MKKSETLLWLALGWLAIGLIPNIALGSLGDTVGARDLQLGLADSGQKILPFNQYTVRERPSPFVTVREYVSPAGVVFGVAWVGRVHPPLRSILGHYHAQYETALRQHPRHPGHRYHRVQSDRLVVERGGHQRKFQGRAYDPSLLPTGVTADAIQ